MISSKTLGPKWKDNFTADQKDECIQRPVSECRENCSYSSGSVRDEEFLDPLSDCRLLKKDSTARSERSSSLITPKIPRRCVGAEVSLPLLKSSHYHFSVISVCGYTHNFLDKLFSFPGHRTGGPLGLYVLTSESLRLVFYSNIVRVWNTWTVKQK
jgi:hypothetical protein